jgi:hypothetical protein
MNQVERFYRLRAFDRFPTVAAITRTRETLPPSDEDASKAKNVKQPFPQMLSFLKVKPP